MATELVWPSVSAASGTRQTFSFSPAAASGRTPRVALLQAVWGGYCEGMFRELATTAPAELATLVRQGVVRDTRLTYAAEILGRDVNDSTLVVPALLPLLKHPSPAVREGAVLGLSYHLTDGVRLALSRVVQEDPSPGVRTVAQEAVAD